jgi:hypothetical protein
LCSDAVHINSAAALQTIVRVLCETLISAPFETMRE